MRWMISLVGLLCVPSVVMAQQAQSSCGDQRAALAVHVQILQNSRAQVEAELSRLAIEADKLGAENARLKAEAAKAKISGQTAPQQ